MMTVDPAEKGAQYKKEQIAKLINFTEEQKTIVDLYILEEKTQARHWQWDPEDPNVYIEWMNGTTLLRNKVNERLNMTRAQKMAMNNNSTVQQGTNNGYSPPQQQQAPPPVIQQAPQLQQQPTIPPRPSQPTTTSTFQHRPISPNSSSSPRPIKKYPRRSRK